VKTRRNHEYTRLVYKEVSDLWKVPTSEGDSILSPFTPEELANTLKHLKSGKSPSLDSIFPEFILHTGSSLEILVVRFLHFLHAPTQNSKDLEKSTNSCDP